MLTALVVLQSLSLVFLIALYGTASQLTDAISSVTKFFMQASVLRKESSQPHPWPEREN